MSGLIEIAQLSEDDLVLIDEEGRQEDFRDYEFDGGSIVTTAAGARALAALLIKAAEESEKIEGMAE